MTAILHQHGRPTQKIVMCSVLGRGHGVEGEAHARQAKRRWRRQPWQCGRSRRGQPDVYQCAETSRPSMCSADAAPVVRLVASTPREKPVALRAGVRPSRW